MEVAVDAVVTVGVTVEVRTTFVASGLRWNQNTNTATRPVNMMAARNAAGMKAGVENRLLGLGLVRGAPHIRHSLALRETLAPQVGQNLLSSAILARFHPQGVQEIVSVLLR